MDDKQPFEAHPELAAQIENLAWKAQGLTMSRWNKFCAEINAVCTKLAEAEAANAVLKSDAVYLHYQVKALMDFHDDHQNKPCGQYGAECPIGMGEWFENNERERIAEIAGRLGVQAS